MRTVNREMSESDRSLLRVIVGAAIMWLVVLGFVVVRSAFGARVLASQVSPDGLWKVTIEEINQPADFQLYSTLIATGAKKEIGVVATRDQDVFEFVISADSKTVAYRYGSTPTGRSHLYTTPIYALGGRQISQIGGRVDPGIRAVSGGAWVRYVWSAVEGGAGSPFGVPMTGGVQREEIFADGFESGGVTKW